MSHHKDYSQRLFHLLPDRDLFFMLPSSMACLGLFLTNVEGGGGHPQVNQTRRAEMQRDQEENIWRRIIFLLLEDKKDGEGEGGKGEEEGGDLIQDE